MLNHLQSAWHSPQPLSMFYEVYGKLGSVMDVQEGRVVVHSASDEWGVVDEMEKWLKQKRGS